MGQDADWEIFDLLREVRRRVRARQVLSALKALTVEPQWIAALPKSEANATRTLLKATRRLALVAESQRKSEVTARRSKRSRAELR